MVDKTHPDPAWRLGTALAVFCSAAVAYVAMFFIALYGVFFNCGMEGSSGGALCDSEVFGAIASAGLLLAAAAIAGTGISWVVRGRGGGAYAWSLAAGAVWTVSIPLSYAAVPAA
jgi:hypothetical protein